MEVCNVFDSVGYALHDMSYLLAMNLTKKTNLTKMLRFLLSLFNACGLKMKPLHGIT